MCVSATIADWTPGTSTSPDKTIAQDSMRASSLPCIRHTVGQHLRDCGFSRAEAVLGKYLTFDKNERRFKTWLKESCGADERVQQECYHYLQEWSQTHL